jgi:hypothetical protein
VSFGRREADHCASLLTFDNRARECIVDCVSVDYVFASIEGSQMKARSRMALHCMADYLDCLVERLLYFEGNLWRELRSEKPDPFSSK